MGSAARPVRRVARERLNKDIDEVSGGHLVALSNPRGLADRLIVYAEKYALT